MPKSILRIATRKSPLALWQAHRVRDILQNCYTDLIIQLVEITTQGDKILDAPLAKIGGKGLFTKELEQALLQGHADIAVHSMKDVPIDFPPGLHLPVIMQREEAFDAFVSNDYPNLLSLPQGAIVGTSSLRRQSQLLVHRPDLKIQTLRGNVGTRLSKLDNGHFTAIILAVAGLRRLGMESRIRQTLTPDVILPAIGQGAIGIECRTDDEQINKRIQNLDDLITHRCVQAERAINQRLGGSCQVPIGGFAQIEGRTLNIRGLIADLQGYQVLHAFRQGAIEQATQLGQAVADDLLAQGAQKILDSLSL
jgi:hydroxymethylbilane synthase